jgi:hypothetical protein
MNVKMRLYQLGIPVVALMVSAGCKKDPGSGGDSSIRGEVFREVRIVLTNPGTVQYTAPAADQDIYIIYGDHISPDDRVWSNYRGEYEFINLREGRYTIYTYSKDTTGQAGVDPDRMVVLDEVEITDRKQTVTADDLTVYDVP